ncbi:(CysO sulfur-carrier protein)-S-L-cysteine hydrolase [Gammaproteobacteria bacterium]
MLLHSIDANTPNVILPRALIHRLLYDADTAEGHEICGLIGRGTDLNCNYYPVVNIAEDPARLFSMDPAQQIAALRTMRERNETLYAIYHSHPQSPAFPSLIDITEMAYSEALYLIVSLETAGVLELRGFRLQDGGVTEVALTGEP